MKPMKKLVCIMLAFVMILTVGCAGEKTEEANSGTHVIVDHLGFEVEVPYEVNRIAVGNILPLPSVLTVFLTSLFLILS